MPMQCHIKSQLSGVKFYSQCYFSCLELLWTAPELLRMHPKQWPIYGTKPGDVYSYGILLYEILHRDIPYGYLLTNLGAGG